MAFASWRIFAAYVTASMGVQPVSLLIIPYIRLSSNLNPFVPDYLQYFQNNIPTERTNHHITLPTDTGFRPASSPTVKDRNAFHDCHYGIHTGLPNDR